MTQAKWRNVYIDDRHSFYTKYELETWIAPSDEFCVLAFKLQSLRAKYAL